MLFELLARLLRCFLTGSLFRRGLLGCGLLGSRFLGRGFLGSCFLGYRLLACGFLDR